jgi:hypothetical protein
MARLLRQRETNKLSLRLGRQSKNYISCLPHEIEERRRKWQTDKGNQNQ